MQIHEITRPLLKEGAWSNIGRGLASGLTGSDIPQSQASIERDAADAAEKLRAQGYGQPAKEISVQDAIAGVKKNPQQQQFIKGLVTRWQQQAPKPEPVAPAPGTPTAPFAGRSAPLPTVDVSGNLITKTADGVWRGEDGRAVTDPAQVSKLDKAYYTGMTKQKGIVKERVNNPQRNAAIRAQRAAGRKPTASAPTPSSTSSYQTTFEKWAAQQLQTDIPRVGTITLDDIKKTDIRDELDRALAQVVATAGDAQQNAVAVNNYLTIAVAGVARQSKKMKQKLGSGGETGAAGAVPASQVGSAVVTQQEIRNELSRFDKTELDTLTKLIKDPASRLALLKSFGVQA